MFSGPQKHFRLKVQRLLWEQRLENIRGNPASGGNRPEERAGGWWRVCCARCEVYGVCVPCQRLWIPHRSRCARRRRRGASYAVGLPMPRRAEEACAPGMGGRGRAHAGGAWACGGAWTCACCGLLPA